MKIIKKDLCDKVYEKVFNDIILRRKNTKNEIQFIIEQFLESIIEELLAGNTIELRGLGTFERTLKKARDNAINPQTGCEVESKDYYKATFHQGKKLKERMKEVPVIHQEKPQPQKPVITSPHWEPDLETLSEYNKRYKQMRN